MMKDDQLLIGYLEKSLNDEEFKQVEDWLQEEEHRDYLHKTKRIWESSKNARVFDQINFSAANRKVQDCLGHKNFLQKERKFGVPYFAKIAASIAVFVGIGIAFLLFYQESQWITISATDTAKEYKLPDGSYVTLNKNSQLRVAKDLSEQRNVELAGEAFFDIERDEKRPFEVTVGALVVKVLGTSFNIKKRREEIEVSVASGKVEVREKNNPSNRQLLAIGEAVFFSEKQKIEKRVSDPNANSWKTGAYSFDGTPVIDALRLIAENQNEEVRFTNPALIASCTITARFDKQSWAEILDELKLITSLQFQKQGEVTVVSGSKCL